MKTYEITFGPMSLRYAFHYEDTPNYMRPYINEVEGENYDILSPLDYMEKLRPFYPESQDDAYVEYKSLINLSSLALLKNKAVFFHAAAFRYHGKAILFTGRSGSGKTTQYKKWKAHFKNEVEMICGDMPCLVVNGNAEIEVFPSPWNGKERIKGKVSAPLGAVIFLEQKDYNEIFALPAREAIAPLFSQFAVDADTEEDIQSLANIADVILKKYPVLKLYNKADEEALQMTVAALKEYL